MGVVSRIDIKEASASTLERWIYNGDLYNLTHAELTEIEYDMRCEWWNTQYSETNREYMDNLMNKVNTLFKYLRMTKPEENQLHLWLSR